MKKITFLLSSLLYITMSYSCGDGERGFYNNTDQIITFRIVTEKGCGSQDPVTVLPGKTACLTEHCHGWHIDIFDDWYGNAAWMKKATNKQYDGRGYSYANTQGDYNFVFQWDSSFNAPRLYYGDAFGEAVGPVELR